MKARVKLQQKQRELLLAGKTITIKLPSQNIDELELSLSYASAEEQQKIADGFAKIGQTSAFKKLWPDLFK